MHDFLHSIKTKLTFLIAIVIIAISLFIHFYFPAKFEESQLDALKDKVNTLADIASYSVAGAIFFEDLDATIEQIAPLLKSDEIEYIVIHLPNGSVYYDYNLPSAD